MLLIGIFPYVALEKFCFAATGHSFSFSNVEFGLRRKIKDFWYFFSKIPFFSVKGVIFPLLWLFLI